MEEVQLKVKVPSELKDRAMEKAKAEDKTMKQVIEELLSSYVNGEAISPVPVEVQAVVTQPRILENGEVVLFPNGLQPQENRMSFENWATKVWNE